MLDVALKEWSVVCDLLLEGHMSILLRKGGIHETGGPGVFELEHSRFALFPSWAHQDPAGIKPLWRGRASVLDEPREVRVMGLAQAVAIYPVSARAQLDSLTDLHCWTQEYVDMRFDYKPDRPLYVVVLRSFRLARARVVKNHPDYAGCRSWVPLRPGDQVDDSDAQPMTDDTSIQTVATRVKSAVSV